MKSTVARERDRTVFRIMHNTQEGIGATRSALVLRGVTKRVGIAIAKLVARGATPA
jgi:hypothetical protein